MPYREIDTIPRTENSVVSLNRHDKNVLRDLVKRVVEIASLPEQAAKIRLWTACNDLNAERAMVYADPANGWSELEAAWIELQCEDRLLRQWEHRLRCKLLRHEHIPDDFPILNTFDIPTEVTGNGEDDYGLALKKAHSKCTDGAYHIEPIINNDKDLQKLHYRPIQINHNTTDQNVDLAKELLGDILDVRKAGKTYWRYGLTRVLIHMHGLEEMMLNMYDNPGLIHRLMGFLRDDFLREIDLFERENAVGLNNKPDNVNGSGGLGPTTSLPGENFDGTPKIENSICWGESQETISVSPRLFDEFVLQYQIPIMERFGLTDYGCCEPLDSRLDLLIAKIPNLRWVAVSPWADREVCRNKIGNKYVYVYKPNPATICSPEPNWDQAERDIRHTLSITKGCSVHIVMKDTSTFCNEPERITRWARMATRIAKEMA